MLAFSNCNITIKSISIFRYIKLLVIINCYFDCLVTSYFFLDASKLLNIWMTKCFINSQPLLWIKLEKLVYKIQTLIISSRKECSKSLLLGYMNRIQHISTILGIDSLYILFARWTQYHQHFFNLI